MTAAERAETYLRLMAESELRRALGYPGTSRRTRLGRSRRCARQSASPVRCSPRCSRRYGPRPACPARCSRRCGRPTHCGLGGPADDSRAGGRAGSLAGAAGPPGSPGVPGRPRPLRRPPAKPGQDRVRLVASALVQAAVLGESAAQAALDGLTDALALRGETTPGRTYGPPGSGSWGPGSRWLPSTPPPLPGGPVRAVPLGTAVPLGSGADRGEAGLLALVLAPDRAVLTAAVRMTEPGPGGRRPGRGPPAPLPFGASWRPTSGAPSTGPAIPSIGRQPMVGGLRADSGTAPRDPAAGHHRAGRQRPGPGRPAPHSRSRLAPGLDFARPVPGRPAPGPIPRPGADCPAAWARPSGHWTPSRSVCWPTWRADTVRAARRWPA